MEQYIVINKTKLEERIIELTRESLHCLKDGNKRSLEGAIASYNDVINESTPLEPIISDTWDACSKLKSGQNVGIRNKTEYIDKLKLDN